MINYKMKTKVLFKMSDNDYKSGDIGYIDGYVSINDVPHLCIVVNDKIVFCKQFAIIVISERDYAIRENDKFFLKK